MKTVPYLLTSIKILEKIFSENIVGAMEVEIFATRGKRIYKPLLKILGGGTRDRLPEQSHWSQGRTWM